MTITEMNIKVIIGTAETDIAGIVVTLLEEIAEITIVVEMTETVEVVKIKIVVVETTETVTEIVIVTVIAIVIMEDDRIIVTETETGVASREIVTVEDPEAVIEIQAPEKTILKT